jgi:hypothetical protein
MEILIIVFDTKLNTKTNNLTRHAFLIIVNIFKNLKSNL